MIRLDLLEDYFIKIYKNFGISKLKFENNRIDLDESQLKNLVFTSEDFDDEFDNLLTHCRLLYRKLKKNFSLKIKKDINDNYVILIA